jgi:hypothetical protein
MQPMSSAIPLLQEYVDNVAGAVNINDIGVDGSGNGITNSEIIIAGIFYENSSGTVNHVEARYQEGNQDGVGIWAESGSAASTVTVEYSNVQISTSLESGWWAAQVNSPRQSRTILRLPARISARSGRAFTLTGQLLSRSAPISLMVRAAHLQPE